MTGDNELEKRAIEELLRETDRARVRAETMGPAGWLKCPLRSTNKRFLLNTLRSTGLQQRSGEPAAGHSATRGRLRRSESPGRSRDRSRSPAGDHRSDGGHADRKHRHRDRRKDRDKKRERHKERRHKHKDEKDGTRGEGHNRDEDRQRQND